MTSQVLIVAAGRGTRLGSEMPKALYPLCGIPMIIYTLRAFLRAGIATPPVIVVGPEEVNLFRSSLGAHLPDLSPTLVLGGAERQDSVRNGLEGLAESTEIVFIHDAARPFIQANTIVQVLTAANASGAATVAIPAVDTILEADGAGHLAHTPDRTRLWQCQTPQVFRKDLIRAAHAWAREEGVAGTDDGTVVQRFGHPVTLVPGTRFNLKVTTPEDVVLAELLIREGLV